MVAAEPALPWRKERISEVMAGGAALLLQCVSVLFWSFVQSADLGATVKAAIRSELGLGLVALLLQVGSLGAAAQSMRAGAAVAPWYANGSQLLSAVFATVVAAGVAPRISLVSVYQAGQADPQLQNITILTWFAWVWTLAWLALRMWNDNNVAGVAKEVLEKKVKAVSEVDGEPADEGEGNASEGKQGGAIGPGGGALRRATAGLRL